MIEKIVEKLLTGDLGVELAPGEVRPFTLDVCGAYYVQHKIEHFFRRLDGVDVICAVDFDPCKFFVVFEDERIFYVVDDSGVISPDVASMRFLMNDFNGEYVTSVSESDGLTKSVFQDSNGMEVSVVDNRLEGADRVVEFYVNGVLQKDLNELWAKANRKNVAKS